MARNPKAAKPTEADLQKALDALDPGLAEVLRGQFDDLRDEITRMSETLAAMGRSGAAAARAGVAGAQDAAEEKLTEARERLAGVQGEVEAFTRNEPVKALGIAAGIGLFLGLLLSRR
ncbi:hypothetical protein B6K69_12000 [Fuscovulum blasticum]|nr:hypothetical protein B6K69_12000 [Fuscovulum blasticum]